MSDSARQFDHEDDYWQDDYEDDHPVDCDCEDCTYEYYASECGLLPDHLGGGCQLAGTEHCDFDCPFRDDD